MIRRSFVLGTMGLVLVPTQGFAADTVSGLRSDKIIG